MADDFFAAAKSHSLQSLIDMRARETPDAVFFISPESGKIFSYGELARRARAMGAALQTLPPGAPLGVMAGNGWAAAQALLGAPYHGRMALIFNAAAGDSQLAYMIQHSGCRLVYADAEHMARAQNIIRQCEGARVVAVDRDAGFCGKECAPPKVAADSPALLIYTSGTTGKPKGVLHSHRSLLYGGANTAAAHELTAADRALCVLPLCHINGQCVTIMAPLVSGGSVVAPHKFSAGNFWRQIKTHECTWFSAVPTILSHILNGEDAPPLPHLRFGRSASSALPPETLRRFEQKFSVPLVETMGLTETAAQILSNPPPPQKGKTGSPGVAVGCEVRIMRGGGEAAAGEEGEIAVRGGNLMLGYLHEKSAFTDGWFMTGDLGRMDADGYVFVTGRTKELIIKGGENIAPREIDDALYAAPGVVEAAAFGVPCKVYGQQVEAAAVAESFAQDEAKLLAACEKAVGKFKTPRRIHFLPSLPKGPSGKIQRLKLAELCGARKE